MNRRQAPGPCHRMAMVTLLMVALWSWPAAGQTARDTTQSAAEQRRAEERDARLREQAVPEREARVEAPEAKPAPRLPPDESPCFVIEQIELRGEAASQFAWVLDALTAPDGLDGPLRRCLGAAGVGVLVQRAQQAVVARGFVTSRVMVEPQDLTQGHLVLAVVPGRIRQVRFAKPAQRHASARLALPTQPGDLLNLRDIEQALENFKRVPGVEVDIQIVPANEPGLSDLVIDWTPGQPVRVQLGVDDGGSRSTGRYQGSATLSLDNPLNLNDLFYVGLQDSLGGGDPGARGTSGSSWHYSLPWGRALLAVDVSRHRYHQTVAGDALDYTYRGTTGSQEVTLSYLAHRNATSKTTLHVKAFARQSRNFIDDTEVEVQRRRVGGWQLQGGQVRVEGLGLDVSLSDHAAVLARAVAVNAGIWANVLTVVTGVNDVSADASRVTSRAAAGVAPAFALDVAALGGMYAGKIRLVGTEAGLGVNQAGLIDAQGPLTLDVNGWLGQSAGARLYGDGVSIRAQGVRNKDGAVIAARDSLSIVAGATRPCSARWWPHPRCKPMSVVICASRACKTPASSTSSASRPVAR